MDRVLKRLLIVLVVLIILAPLGLLASGTAFGEWSADDIQKLVGYVPSGLQSLSSLWNPPLPDYGYPAAPAGFIGDSLGYYLSAIIGAVVGGGALFLIGKALTKNTAENNE
ncbi:MAG TPA: PDGLE domain-containing protein [Candidatus Acidoferrum sp.]|nr:PDGLE domain-containing protein [Candidatus Acidoferrum sp.]